GIPGSDLRFYLRRLVAPDERGLAIQFHPERPVEVAHRSVSRTRRRTVTIRQAADECVLVVPALDLQADKAEEVLARVDAGRPGIHLQIGMPGPVEFPDYRDLEEHG